MKKEVIIKLFDDNNKEIKVGDFVFCRTKSNSYESKITKITNDALGVVGANKTRYVVKYENIEILEKKGENYEKV